MILQSIGNHNYRKYVHLHLHADILIPDSVCKYLYSITVLCDHFCAGLLLIDCTPKLTMVTIIQPNPLVILYKEHRSTSEYQVKRKKVCAFYINLNILTAIWILHKAVHIFLAAI